MLFFRGNTEMMPGVVYFLVLVGGVLFAVLGHRFGRRFVPKQAALKPFYSRLCQISPDDPCPCDKSNSTSKAYKHCCRASDLENLEQEVRQVIWTDWMRRSSGRSQMRSMKLRLEDFPMSEFSLPEWVAHPEDHTFPIDEEIVRAWTPLQRHAGSPGGGLSGADFGGDLPL